MSSYKLEEKSSLTAEL